MKRRAVTSIVILVLALAITLFVGLKSPRPNVPRFTKVQPPASVRHIHYDFLSPRPFEQGKMWIDASFIASSGATNFGAFVYDIEHRRVLGQVTKGWPAMLFGNPPQLLCYRPAAATGWNAMRERLLRLVKGLSLGRIQLQSPATEGQMYWLLDLEHDAARRLGYLPGPNCSLLPSPDFHYCFTARQGQRLLPDYYLLDLRKRLIQRLDAPQWPCDWWDDTHLLLQTTNCDFLLYDVRTKATSPLIAFEKIAAFLQEQRMADDPRQTHAFAIWNGRENDFYLTDTHQKWPAQESFLIKLERPNGKLRLVSPRFKSEWSDHLDPTGRQYLYTGREAGEASDGVFLRDLDRGTNRVLVASPPDKYFSIPRFYRDSVIYVRSNALWQISLDGSNTVRLFPPAEAQAGNARPDVRQDVR
jgi:hypothetical protein